MTEAIRNNKTVRSVSRIDARRAARADLALSVSGVLLTLFMWMHMFFVSSILISEEAMWTVARLFEGEPLFGRPYPVLVSFVVVAVLGLMLVHAVLALRRYPGSVDIAQRWLRHNGGLAHPDTSAWWLQLVTGVALMFLAAPHLYQMLIHPADIGPYLSADRVYSHGWAPLYMLLLLCVELHAAFGIYRVAVKWGWGGDRNRLKTVKWSISVFFIALGLVTLAAYWRIGAAHADRVGEPWRPAAAQVGS